MLYVKKWPKTLSKSFSVNTARFLKYVRPLFNNMQEMVRTFTTGGIEGLPTRAENLLISPTRKNPPSRLTPPKFYFPLSNGSFPSPLDNNFRVITYYNPIKTLFLAIVIAPVAFF